MILKGAQRANAYELARHLLKSENEVVDVAELRGFASETLIGALQEIKAISRATKCKTYLYSLSFNPPPDASVTREEFEDAIERAEELLGLSGQPRAVVYHTKEARTHCHVVWSRVGPNLKAIKLNFPKRKLKGLSIEIFHQFGWQLPAGFQEGQEANPMNYTYQEYHEAKRGKFEAKRLKMNIRSAWIQADNRAAFETALEQSGLFLAQGDRRSFVCVDYDGNVYSLSRWSGAKRKELSAKLGEPELLRDVAQTQATVAERMTPRMIEFVEAASRDAKSELQVLETQRSEMNERYRDQRSALRRKHHQQWDEQVQEHSQRFSKGLKGLWHRISGRHAKIAAENEAATRLMLDRFNEERVELQERQRNARSILQNHIQEARSQHQEVLQSLYQQIHRYHELGQFSEQEQRQHSAQLHENKDELERALALDIAL